MKNKPVVIFRFSQEKGVLEMSDLSGRPVVIEMMGNNISSSVNMISAKTGDDGYDKIYYRIPEVVDIRVTDGKRNLGGKRQLVYQFGKKVALPANFILGK